MRAHARPELRCGKFGRLAHSDDCRACSQSRRDVRPHAGHRTEASESSTLFRTIQRADTLRPSHLVTADGVQIHSEFSQHSRDPSGCLYTVRVHQDTGFARNSSDLLHRLNGPDLVVHMHDRNQLPYSDVTRGARRRDRLTPLARNRNHRHLTASPLQFRRRPPGRQDARSRDVMICGRSYPPTAPNIA